MAQGDADRGAAAVLAELSAQLRRATDARSVLAATLTGMRRVVDVEHGAIWEHTTGGLRIEAAEPVQPGDAAPDPRLDALAAIADEAARARRVVTGGALAAAPLVALGQQLGVLTIRARGSAALGNGSTELLESVALQAAAALESVRRFHEVMELERLKRDFINRVSHELRTPITIINGFLSTLLAHGDAVEATQRAHMLERSLAASDRLAGLIEELLVLSRLEAGVLRPALDAVPLRELLGDVRAGSERPDDVELGAVVEVVLTTDSELTRRALGYLVDNALKYAGQAELTAHRTGDAVVVDVRDRGPGMPADVRPTLFEMFTRGAGTTDVPGLGVGLPVARTLLEVVGARIDVLDPPDGVGALVRTTFPA